MALLPPNASKRLPLLCKKTALCTFNQRGRCTKGPSCNFAHSPGEVKAPPDLQKTKLCAAVVSGLDCSNPGCPFAHSREELRAFPRGGKEACDPRPGAAGRQGSKEAARRQGSKETVISLDSAIKQARQAFDSDTASTFSDCGEGDPFSRFVSDESWHNAEGDTFSRQVSDGVCSNAGGGTFSRQVSGGALSNAGGGTFSRQVSGGAWSKAGGDTFSRQVSDESWYTAEGGTFSRQVSGGALSNAGGDTFSRQVSDGLSSSAWDDTFSRQVSGGAWSKAGGDTFSRQVSDGLSSSAWDDTFSRQVSDGVTSCAESGDLNAGTAPPKTKLMQQLRKTRLCVFFSEGRCKRGKSCNFAHDQKELKPKPDLARTRMCASLQKYGKCDNVRCTYAHSQDELESEGGKQSDNNDGVCKVNPTKFRSWGGESAPPLITKILECIIDVKNTFLDVVDMGGDRALALRRRSTHSAPPRLSHKEKAVRPPAPANKVGDPPAGHKGGDMPDVPESTRPSPPGRRKPAGCDFVPSLAVPLLAPGT